MPGLIESPVLVRVTDYKSFFSFFACISVCDDCGKQYIYGDCPDHGPLEWLDDCQPASGTQQRNQARFTLPNNLYFMPSAAGPGRMGVFTKARIERRVIFGPFRGQKIPAKEFPLGEDHSFMHMWDVSMRL